MSGIVRTSLMDQVLGQLRQEILDGTLSPQEHHSASALAVRLGVSRTPVREAILALEQDGLVRIIPNRGIKILTAGLDEIVDSIEIRLLLEVPTVARAVMAADEETRDGVAQAFRRMELAAQDEQTEGLLIADRDFHLALLGGHANQRLLRVLAEIRDHVIAGGAATVPHSRTHRELLEDHRPILQAALAGDAQAAAAAMGEHILNTATLLIHRLATAQDEDPRPWVERLEAAVPRV